MSTSKNSTFYPLVIMYLSLYICYRVRMAIFLIIVSYGIPFTIKLF